MDNDKEEISEEQLERARSSSFSFRDGLDTDRTQSRKSIFLPTTVNAITCKILIPHLSATKIVKFEGQTKAKDVIRVMILKHRFTGGIENFVLIQKGVTESADVNLNPEETLNFYGIKDWDQFVLKVKDQFENLVTIKPEETQVTINSEVLIPKNLQKSPSPSFSEPDSHNNINNQHTKSEEIKKNRRRSRSNNKIRFNKRRKYCRRSTRNKIRRIRIKIGRISSCKNRRIKIRRIKIRRIINTRIIKTR